MKKFLKNFAEAIYAVATGLATGICMALFTVPGAIVGAASAFFYMGFFLTFSRVNKAMGGPNSSETLLSSPDTPKAAHPFPS